MLVRWNDFGALPRFATTRPFGSRSALRRELERLFWDFERGDAQADASPPQLTFTDKGDALELRGLLPGVSEKDLDVQVTGKVLSLKASREVQEPKGYVAHRRERSSFSYTQSYELPVAVDAEKVTATLKQGVLTLVLPKANASQPKRISVQAS